MTRPSRYPVASFGPELLAALVTGARRPITIPLKTHREVAWLQQRIHMLRGAMGREKHPQYSLVQRARTSRMWDEPEGTPRSKTGTPSPHATNFRLIIQPNDIQFADAFKAAGIEVNEEAMRDVLEERPDTTPPDPSTQAEQPSPHNPTEDPYASYKA